MGFLQFFGDESWTDYSLTLRAQGKSRQSMFIVYFRASNLVSELGHPIGDWYRLDVWHGGSTRAPQLVNLKRRKNDTVTNLFQETLPWIGDDPIDVAIEVVGNRIQIWLDGIQVVDHLDLDPLLSGRIGVSAIWNEIARFDNIIVTRRGEPVLVDSYPASGSIDPRAEVGGTDEIMLTFNRPVFRPDGTPLDTTDLTVSFTGNPMIQRERALPDVFAVMASPDRRTIFVTLTEPIPVGEWTSVTVKAASSNGATSTSSVQFAHLPCDVNQDGVVNIRDATAFGQEFRGQRRPEMIDLDRSGAVNVSDATEFGRLWRGEGPVTRAWAGMRLPDPSE